MRKNVRVRDTRGTCIVNMVPFVVTSSGFNHKTNPVEKFRKGKCKINKYNFLRARLINMICILMVMSSLSLTTFYYFTHNYFTYYAR